MGAISPVYAQTFVSTIVNKFDGAPSENTNEANDQITTELTTIVNEFKAKEFATADDVSKLDSDIYDICTKISKLSDLFKITSWLNPPENDTHQALLDKIIEAKFKEWKIPLQEHRASQEQFCNHIFEKVITKCTEAEQNEFFVQLDRFRVHLDRFECQQERVVFKVQSLFVRWSELQKNVIVGASLAAAILIGWVVLPPIKTWLGNTVVPALVSQFKMYGNARLVKMGESLYQRSLAIDNWFLRICPKFLPLSPTFSLSEGVALVIAKGQISRWSSFAEVVFHVDWICEGLREGDVTSVLFMPRLLQMFKYPVFSPAVHVQKEVIDKKIDFDTAMKAYQVWIHLMMKGPEQGLFT